MHATDMDDVILNTLGVALFLCIKKNRCVGDVLKNFRKAEQIIKGCCTMMCTTAFCDCYYLCHFCNVWQNI